MKTEQYRLIKNNFKLYDNQRKICSSLSQFTFGPWVIVFHLLKNKKHKTIHLN